MWDRLRNLTCSGSTAKGQNSSESPARQRLPIRFLPRTRAIRAVLDRVDVITAASLNYPHPPAFSDAVVACDSEGPEPRNPCFAQAAVARYCRRGTRAAGYRGRGTRAGRMDHACAPPPRAGARLGAARHPHRFYECAIAQALRGRDHRHQGCH